VTAGSIWAAAATRIGKANTIPKPITAARMWMARMKSAKVTAGARSTI
jgi:hypothetical protein